VTTGSIGVPAPLSSDGEFLRRVSIDFIGMPPTFEELEAFLADTTPNKRELAIDRLLASPHFARNMATYFDVMLMERRAATEVSADEWMSYLLKSFQENKPYNVLVREMLTANSEDPATRMKARFVLDRAGEPNAVTRDVGRIFFGVDMQCAQCHDHPLISDYRQTDYHGLLAFFGASTNLQIMEGAAMKSYYIEKAHSDVTFESVFVKGVRHVVAPQLPGEAEITEPVVYPGDEYHPLVAGAKAPVPKYSRRQKFVELATGGQNRMFNENIANRLWAYMMGRGLVSPPDLRHSSNPPTHPELLRVLGERFAAMNFNVPAFLREIALTQVYQRAIDRPTDVAAAAETAVSAAAALLAEQEHLKPRVESARQAEEKLLKEWNEAQAAVLPVLAERDAAVAKSQEVVKKLEAANKALNDAKAAAAAKEGIATTVGEAAAKATEVTQKLPMDAELLAAAAKFNERLATLKAEVEVLKKAAAEKEAAVAPVNTELTSSRGVIDAAVAKLNPLRDACRAKHDAWAASKAEMQTLETSLNRVEQKLATAKALAEAKTQQSVVAAVEKSLAESRAITEASMAKMAEMNNSLPTVDAAYQQSIRDLAAATATIASTKESLAKHQDSTAALEAAINSSKSALEKLPADVALTEALATLTKRKLELDAAVIEQQKAVEAAIVAEKAAGEKRAASQEAFEIAFAERGRRQESADAAKKASDLAVAKAAESKAAFDAAVAALTANWSNDGLVASLKPLTPEQMCASVFRVTGIYENYKAVEVAELDKAAPMTDADKQDAAKVASRQRDLEQRVHDKLLKPHRPMYVNLYGAAAGAPQDDFFASPDQALFTANADAMISWSGQQGNNVTTRMLGEPDVKKAARILYETVLSRPPSADETADVEKYLTSRPAEQKPAAAQELVWSLIASVEFRMNH
jgi:hypothetical protein